MNTSTLPIEQRRRRFAALFLFLTVTVTGFVLYRPNGQHPPLALVGIIAAINGGIVVLAFRLSRTRAVSGFTFGWDPTMPRWVVRLHTGVMVGAGLLFFATYFGAPLPTVFGSGWFLMAVLYAGFLCQYLSRVWARRHP